MAHPLPRSTALPAPVERARWIPLTKGKWALVDDEDYEEMNRWSWYCNNSYAARDFRENGVRVNLKMHRAITNTPAELEVDHRNGDKLDNRRKNLRIATHAQNLKNMKKHKDNSTGFKGVKKVSCRVNKTNPYQAIIMVDGKSHSLGYFLTPEAAAQAYDKGARELHGEYSRTNKDTQ